MNNKRVIKYFFIVVFLLISLFLYSQQTTNNYLSLSNGCVVDAIQYKYSLIAEKKLTNTSFCRILVIKFVDQDIGHALCIFDYNNKLFCYDYKRGARQLIFNTKDSALATAQQIYNYEGVKDAYYLEK